MKNKKFLKYVMIACVLILIAIVSSCDLFDKPSADSDENDIEEILGEWIKIKSLDNHDFEDVVLYGECMDKYIFKRDGSYTRIYLSSVGITDYKTITVEGTYELKNMVVLPELDYKDRERKGATLILYPDTDKKETYQIEMDYSGLGKIAIKRLILDKHNIYRDK